MSPIIINGPNCLTGEVSVRGAKNAALPILIAAAAGAEPVTLTNVPATLVDIQTTIETLQYVGCRVRVSDGEATVTPSTGSTTVLPAELTSRFRSSLLFLGLLTGKHGHAEISLPGGCKLGERKFDLHLEGLKRLGAEVRVSDDKIEVFADRLVGTDIHFYLPTTTGTENVMLAACFAEGRTRILNANTRPEVVEMAACLNAMGAEIRVKNRVVEVVGGHRLRGCRHHIMSGWDEALTYMLAAAITGGEICIRDFTLEHVRADVQHLRGAGVDVFEWGGNVYVSGKNKQFNSFDLFTAPYPGVNSDMQPLFAAFAGCCHGESTITDQRFTERFQYTTELAKLGLLVEAFGNCAVVRGPAMLRGAKVTALDLRCGGALVLAGLAAQGTTVIENVWQIARGYEHIVDRLRALGAQVEQAASPSERIIRRAA